MRAADDGPLIEVEDLYFGYSSRGELALERLSFEIERGRVVGLVGPNGSGKTTLYRLILGFLRPLRGRVVVSGLDPAVYRRSRGIGYLPEQVRLPGNVRVREFAVLIARLAGLGGREVSEAIERYTNTLALAESTDAVVGSLSHGYRQRVGLLAALLGDPELLLFDEPANGLDPASVGVLRSVIRQLKRNRRTVVISSHNLSELQRVCDEVLLLGYGRLLGRSSREELVERPETWVVLLGTERGERPVQVNALCLELGGVRLAADETAFADARSARAFAGQVETAGATVESIERRPFDLEYLFHSLVQKSFLDGRARR
ncbi:MAG: ABC transporter ATP-binding protein [Gemmatimonadota bacterium]|nr:MAG: ABC transporter ATP-binding protein [Gemmatimonadota bacterium]